MAADVQSNHRNEESVALPMRAHTILGVCEALGEDFGINPTWLRVPFAASVLISPTYAILGYLALGVVVLASRLIFPRAQGDQASEQPAVLSAPANCQGEDRLAA